MVPLFLKLKMLKKDALPFLPHFCLSAQGACHCAHAQNILPATLPQ